MKLLQVFLTDTHWAIILVLLPLAAAVLCFLFSRVASFIGVTTLFALLLSVVGLGWQMRETGVYHHAIGGWEAPLGIGLYADGLSLLMLAITALVGLGISIYATSYFKHQDAARFWPLWLLLLASLNALYLSADIFNLYITLELVGLAAVALASLTGGPDALAGAMRYLLTTLLGSLAYLLGVALLYHGYGSVDIAILATQAKSEPVLWVAFGLMGTGLALKMALVPLHFWLPATHANASAPVSALLSALVIKGAFYILLRLWLEIFAPHSGGAETLFGLLGSVAVIWGSLQALRQTRLKLLIAYSTVAQLGYLFIAFPLATIAGATVWIAVAYLALSHALAKAAMFLAAGNLIRFGGHDRIADLDRVVQRLPLTAGAFALAGVSIIGLPPSGGFVGKWLLLESALSQGRWDLVMVILLGSLLAAAYVFKVLGRTFTKAPVSHEAHAVPARMEWVALLLACGAILLGFLAPLIIPLMDIGNPFTISGGQP